MWDSFIASLDTTKILLAVATPIVGYAGVKARRAYKKFNVFRKEFVQVVRDFPSLQKDVGRIKHYVLPNGGGSLMDAAQRTEKAISKLEDNLYLLTCTLDVENDNDVVGKFYCDATGENSYVNMAYARMLGVGKAELMGWDFMNRIHPDDCDKVKHHWEVCRQNKMQYIMRHRMLTVDGSTVYVHVVATPIPAGGEPRKWIGTVRREEAPTNDLVN